VLPETTKVTIAHCVGKTNAASRDGKTTAS
jgi:hypothetical protein